jgi:hypothetical protein
MKHYCKQCDYSTDRKENYEKHLLTKKHLNNKIKIDETRINNNNMVLISEEKIDNLAKQNEELKQKIEHLEKVNNQNTNKIVREAREVKKSILTVLNTKFKDTLQP